jgi:hypothetical protein
MKITGVFVLWSYRSVHLSVFTFNNIRGMEPLLKLIYGFK